MNTHTTGRAVALALLVSGFALPCEAQQRGAVVAIADGPSIDSVVQLAQTACAGMWASTFTNDEVRAARAFLALPPELDEAAVRALGRQLGASWVLAISTLPDQDAAIFLRFALIDLDPQTPAASRFARSADPDELPGLVGSNVTSLLSDWSAQRASDSASTDTAPPDPSSPATSTSAVSASSSSPLASAFDGPLPPAEFAGAQGLELRVRVGTSWNALCTLPCSTSADRGVREFGIRRSAQSDTVSLGDLDIAGHRFDVEYHDQSDIRTGLGVGGAVGLAAGVGLLLWGGLGGPTYMNGYDARGVPQYRTDWLLGPTISGIIVFVAGAVMMGMWPNFRDYGTAERLDMHARLQPLRFIAQALTSGVTF